MVNAYDFKLDVPALQEQGILEGTLMFDDLAKEEGLWAEGPDMLASIFEGQAHLMHDAEPGQDNYDTIERRNGAVRVPMEIYGELDDRQLQIQIKDLMWRITEELGEAANTLKNKPWKQTDTPTDKKHYYEEIADAFHFFVELVQVSGLTAEQLFELYFLKHQVNNFRQRSQY